MYLTKKKEFRGHGNNEESDLPILRICADILVSVRIPLVSASVSVSASASAVSKFLDLYFFF